MTIKRFIPFRHSSSLCVCSQFHEIWTNWISRLDEHHAFAYAAVLIPKIIKRDNFECVWQRQINARTANGKSRQKMETKFLFQLVFETNSFAWSEWAVIAVKPKISINFASEGDLIYVGIQMIYSGGQTCIVVVPKRQQRSTETHGNDSHRMLLLRWTRFSSFFNYFSVIRFV